MLIALVIILAVVLAVLAYDFFGTAANWFGRIKIGSAAEDEWTEITRGVILKWLDNGVPKVEKNEKSRLKLIEKIKDGKKVSSIAYWQTAAVIKAAGMMESCPPQKIQRLAEEYIDIFTGEWKTPPERVDCAMLAYELLQCSAVNNKSIEPAMTYVAEMLANSAKKYGTVPYNENAADVRFVDTVGMICPFLIKYALEYDKPEFIDLAVNQIKAYRENGFDERTDVPFHCYNEETAAPLGICGWARGCAWWTLGVVDSLKTLLECKGRNSEKALLLKLSAEALDLMNKYRREDGSYGRMIFVNSLEDSSAAAMLAYCNMYMYSLVKSEAYKKSAEATVDHLRTCTRRSGVIDYSQGDTMGIGYYSDSLSVMPAAQGFAVAADIMLKSS